MDTNWQVYFFKPFQKMLTQLTDEVELLYSQNPDNYKNHKKTKLLGKINYLIVNDIAINPQATHFNLGNTLGKKYRTWKRAKDRLPPRYRLFFKFKSATEKIIIVWMNNEFTLRKKGDKNDVYSIFLSMLKTGEIPSSWNQLSLKTTPYSNNGRKI